MYHDHICTCFDSSKISYQPSNICICYAGSESRHTKWGVVGFCWCRVYLPAGVPPVSYCIVGLLSALATHDMSTRILSKH